MTRWSSLTDAELDERLTADLLEFTDASRSDEQWAAGTLLPAVRAAISRQVPRPRPAPRFAGFAGLAAVLAVVVMIILVVPRVVPGPAVSPSAVSGLTDPSPSGPSPTNVPIAGTPAPSPSSRVDCPYAGQNGGAAAVAIKDFVGLVVGCVTRSAGTARPSGYQGSVTSVSNPDSDTSRLEVSWMESALCSTLAELELMRIDAGYMIVVDRLPGEQPRMCAQPSASYHGVTLELATAVSADDVDVVLLHAGRGWADVETTGGDFHLSIGSGRREYLAGEAVEIDAELRYFGPADSIELSGSNSGLVAFRIEQLDGDLATGPGWDDACQGYELSMDTPLQVPFEKSGGYSHDDPNAEFYRDFFEEPELRLPPGIWRISAIAHFAIGECGGEQVELTASLIVRATATAASPSPTPEPTASPEPPPSPTATGRTLDCPYETGEDRPFEVEIVDNTGLVGTCTAWPAGDPGVPLEISNPVGDAQVLDVTWQVPGSCDVMPAQLQLWHRDPGSALSGVLFGQTFLVTVDRLPTAGPVACFDALAGQRVQLSLNAPIDSADVEGQFMVSGRGTDWTQTAAGWFGLDLTADKSEYLADEPIDVEATLTYQGPSQVIGVTGSGSGLVQFAIEQLDGNLYLGQGSTADCSSYELTSDSPLRQQYVKAHGYDAADPNAEFIRRYLEDPNVGLPAGTWLISAYSGFMVGDCNGTRVDLAASVMVRTR